jgi:hypothetical protein
MHRISINGQNCNDLPLFMAANKREQKNSSHIAVKIAKRAGWSLSLARAWTELNGLGPRGAL